MSLASLKVQVQVVHPVLDQEYGMEEIEVFSSDSLASGHVLNHLMTQVWLALVI